MKNKQRADRITRDYQATSPYNLRADAAVAFDDEAKLELRRRLIALGEPMLKARLARQIQENRAVRRDMGSVADRGVLPIITRILDTGGTSTGNVLPRVDLEQTITALFVTRFPWWDRIAKEPSNGLKHTWNVATASGAATDAQLSASNDLANAQTDVGTYAQDQTANIAILNTLRGVSLKELYAVEQSGMRYSPETEEMLLGTIRLKSLVQRMIYQGNFSVASKTATSEWGATNTNGFDGLRLIVGALGSYTGGTQVDQDLSTGGGPFTITQAVNYAAAQVLNNGGSPSVLTGSPIALNKLMNEQEGKQRANDSTTLIPGVTVPAVNTVNGNLPYVMAPGSGTGTTSALGNYARQSDSVSVEDLYALDESMIVLRYLGSPDIQVIEIPIGVDTQLSRRFILFLMAGLQVRDGGLFQAKVRIPL